MTGSARADHASLDGEDAQATARRERALVVVLAAAGITMSLSQTLVIPLLGRLPEILGAAPTDTAWIVTVTLLAGAVGGPVMGRLGDLYPKTYVLMGIAAVMTVGSVLCAVSGSLWPMLVGRALQGLGIGVIPVGIALMRESLPPHRLAPAIALMSSSLGVGGALGLPAAAALAQYGSWRWMFWGAALMGVVLVVLFRLRLPVGPAAKPDGHLDLVGAAGLGTVLVALLLAVSKGADWGWTSPLTLGLAALAVVVSPVWAWWVLRHRSPLVDLRVAARTPVLLTNVASVLIGIAMYAQLLVIPQLLQLPRETGYGLGQSMIAMGLWIAPGGLAMMAVSPLSGRLIGRSGPRVTLIAGALVIAAGYLLAIPLRGTPVGLMLAAIVVSGGIGLAYGAMPALIMASVPVGEMASANSVNTLMRSIGTTTSAAVIGLVLATTTRDFHGLPVPAEGGFVTSLLIGAGVAAVSAAVAVCIPRTSHGDPDG